MKYTTSQKFGDTFSLSGISLFLLFLTMYIITEDYQIMKEYMELSL